MKREELAGVLFSAHINESKMNEVTQYLATEISNIFTLLHKVDPIMAKSLVTQINEQLTEETLDRHISMANDYRDEFIAAKMLGLNKGEHLIFDTEETGPTDTEETKEPEEEKKEETNG